MGMWVAPEITAECATGGTPVQSLCRQWKGAVPHVFVTAQTVAHVLILEGDYDLFWHTSSQQLATPVEWDLNCSSCDAVVILNTMMHHI